MTGNSRVRVSLFPLALLLLVGSQSQVFAQMEEDTTIIYPASYFAEYAPVTAQDMLDRIPGQGQNTGGGNRSGGSRSGLSSGSGGNASSGGRGLGAGSGGNELLVNGKRVAGKSNQTSDLLRRISSSQVQEIQIIRGTSGDLDVRGSSQVVNIVLLEELASTSISYDLNAEMYKDDTVQPGGSVSLSSSADRLSYQVSLTSRSRYEHQVSNEESILGDISPNDLVHEERVRDQRNDEISTNLAYQFGNRSSVRLNGLYAQNDAPTDVDRRTTDLRFAGHPLTVEREAIPNDRHNWELGGDYELDFSNGSRFKLLAIANQDNNVTTRERFLQQDDTSEQKNLYLHTDAVTEERILRSSYTFDIVQDQNVEMGIERAVTTLDSSLALGLLSGTAAPSDAVGGLIPQDVNNANSTVEEVRYEPFFIHNWSLNEQLTLESTLLYETSEITQTGDVHNQRDFDFIKPKVELRYDVTPQLQLRGTVEKVVNQLSFADFVAANDEQDNDSNTLAGNAQLRQEWMWRYLFDTEYRLPDDVGVFSAEIFYFKHHDVIDRMDASPSPDKLVSVNGNIGDGWEYGTNLSLSMRMGIIGMPNLLATSTLNLQDSEVTDPFLGIKRRFQNYQRGRFTFQFRHDVPEWHMNWGMDYFDRIDGNLRKYDIDDIEAIVRDPRVNLYVEKVDHFGLTWRFEGGGLIDGAQCRKRQRFDGRISSGILQEIEHQCSRPGPTYNLRVSGTI
ncbi:MAG: TonB-dependent receptor [Gammaproteobacteria bacterium]|nr:TonB-dependent receptor [Pseudomonadales bacterium]MCP5349085.1 TonB-dependent receptor [Pseudomonadales bacterium]